MNSSLRCRITGCDPDPCGVCRRCGSEADAQHAWSDADRDRPCYRKEVCATCGAERENPDHDWEPGVSPTGETALTCSRCGLEI